ncbi:MAG: hypothetical protein FWD49_02875 [Firmicutes bacterium]|nr:hypothetical protein [Bacillota bacterium]
MRISQEFFPKVKTYIGFAIKSKAVAIGTDNILSAKGVKLIILDEALSENSASKLKAKAQKESTKIIFTDSLGELSSRESLKAIGIKNAQLAEAITSTIVLSDKES